MTLSLNNLIAITILPVASYAVVLGGLMLTRAPVSFDVLTACGAALGIASVGLANFLKYRQDHSALTA